MKNDNFSDRAPPDGASYVAENVARLRRDRGLTQQTLADRAGVSRVQIGKIERSQSVPRDGTMGSLARALDAPLRDLLEAVRPLRSVRFGAGSRLKGRAQILVDVARRLDDLEWLEETLGERRSFAFGGLTGTQPDPRTMARAARAAVGLNATEPVPNICRLLEAYGVRVVVLHRQSDAFFGLCVGPQDGGPAVVVNAWSRISVERWIFTAAHELGHLLLHTGEFDPKLTEFSERSAREADDFAGEFLMPEAGFGSEWDAMGGLPFVKRILVLKRMFRVSYRAVLHRLVDTNRVGLGVWDAFRRQYSHAFGRALKERGEPSPLQTSAFAWDWRRAREPVSLSNSDMVHDRLEALVRRACEEGHASIGGAGEMLGLNRYEMRERSRDWKG